MKKNIILLSAVLILPFLSFSQDEWNSTSNSLSPMFRNGFVGIGTSALPTLPFVVTDPTPGLGVRVAFGNNGLIGSFGGGNSVLEVSSQLNTDGAWFGLYSGNGSNRSAFQIGVSPFGAGLYSGKGSTGLTRPILFYTHGTAGMTEKLRIDVDGNVGIGTNAPAAVPFVVTTPAPGIGTKVSFGNNGIIGTYGSGSSVLQLACPNPADGSYFTMRAGTGTNASEFIFGISPFGAGLYSGKGSTGVTQPIVFYTNGTSGMTEKMKIQVDGKVGIGQPSSYPGTYNLYVTGGILTEKVKVAVNGTANWSDYVFANDYKLKPLNEVADFITKNKHLPGVPSAEEVVKNGIDMATMDAKLLEKIEELTLYIIDLKKEVEQLKKESNKASSTNK
jgi:trimeric autotransporter adhesin